MPGQREREREREREEEHTFCLKTGCVLFTWNTPETKQENKGRGEVKEQERGGRARGREIEKYMFLQFLKG
jgi:hypothetical protein